MHYRSLGPTLFNFSRLGMKLSKSTFLRYGFVETGFLASVAVGRVGRFSKPPPQLGHTLLNRSSTQVWQKVHSKVQIMASADSLGSFLPQFSHTGLISSMGV
jgi:hypothetical protein